MRCACGLQPTASGLRAGRVRYLRIAGSGCGDGGGWRAEHIRMAEAVPSMVGSLVL